MKHPVTIVRHPRERLSKCTVEPLRGRPGFHFVKSRPGLELPVDDALVLAVHAPVLSPVDAQDDQGRPRTLVLLDSTWRLLPALECCLRGTPLRRSLPPEIPTAYPRQSKLAADPPAGLASIEALYVALRLLGDDRPDLLDAYHWRQPFLRGLSQANLFT
jgi:pre-rRNA-processing protein TSR3